MPSDIRLDRADGVATITLDAPDRRNALTLDMARELVAACERHRRRPVGGRRGGHRRRVLLRRRRPPDACRRGSRSGHPGRLGRDRPGLPLVRARRRAGATHRGRHPRRRGRRRREPGLRNRPARGGHRRQDRLRLPADRPAPRRRPRRAAGPHRPARGGGRDGACSDRASTAPARPRWAWPGRRSTTPRSSPRPASWQPRPAADPELARRVARSLRAELGPPALPWPAALDMERASQMWSMRRKDLNG